MISISQMLANISEDDEAKLADLIAKSMNLYVHAVTMTHRRPLNKDDVFNIFSMVKTLREAQQVGVSYAKPNGGGNNHVVDPGDVTRVAASTGLFTEEKKE